MMNDTEFMDLLGKLYAATGTPTGEENSYLNNREVQARIDSMLNLDARRKYQDISDDKVSRFVDLLLRLVSSPSSLKGILLAEYPVRCLLFKTCAEVDLPWTVLRLLIRMTNDWFYALRKSPDAAKYLGRPPINESYLFRFHLDAYESSSRGRKQPPFFYKAYALLLNNTLRYKEWHHADISTMDAYGLVARDFFTYISCDLLIKREHPSSITDRYIEDFARGYDISKYRNETGSLSHTVREKVQCLQRLLSFRHLVPRPHGRHQEGGVENNDDKDILNTWLSDGSHEECGSAHFMPRIDLDIVAATIDEPDEEDTDVDSESQRFEAPLEIPVFTIHDQDLRRKPSPKRSWIDAINLRSFKFAWAAQFLQPYHYAMIHYRLKSLWGINDRWDVIIAFLYVAMHTGLDGRYLISMTRYPDNANDHPVLKENDGMRYILIPSLIQNKFDISSACKENSRTVWIPLPEPISILFDFLSSRNCRDVFSYPDTNGRRKISLTDVTSFMKSEVNEGTASKLPGFSLERLRRSFLPLYSHRFGMDPLVATLISGRDHHRLYKSQMHYTHISHACLSREYLKTFINVCNGISAVFREIPGVWPVNRFAGKNEELLFPESSGMDYDYSIVEEDADAFGYGSPIICSLELIRDALAIIKANISSRQRQVARHNLYVVYAYLCAQFSFGLRPRNRPDLLISYDTSTVVIQDKQSIKYLEQRVLPAPRVAMILFNEVRWGFENLKYEIARLHCPSAIQYTQRTPFFFVSEATGLIEDFTLAQMKSVLKGIGFPIDLPLNFPRHFTRNHLYQECVSNDVIDAWFGHQHAGREMTNVTSSAIPGMVMKECLLKIEAMLDEIGFVSVKYKP